MPLAPPTATQRSLARMLATFVLSFFLLQLSWNLSRGSPLERWVLERATVATSATLINTLTPQQHALGRGASVAGRDAAINIRKGCEGTEILFLLLAALIAHPFSWRRRLVGVVAGTLLVFLLNQARLLALFYSLGQDPALFDTLHGLLAPLLLIACTLGFFVFMLEWERRAHGAAPR